MAYDALLNDILEARILTTMGAQSGFVIQHYKVTEQNGVPRTLTQIAQTIDGQVAAAFKAVMTAQATYRGVGVRKIAPGVKTVEYTTVASLGVGTGGATGAPKQLAGLITKVTELAGRHGRGRIYVPFPSTTHLDTDQTPTGAYITVVTNLAGLLLPVMISGVAPNDTKITPCIWDRGNATATLITNYTVRDKWATQRRRGDYGRSNLPPF